MNAPDTKITPALLEQLEAQHKRIAHVKGARDEWECVFRMPTRAEYKAFRARMHNPAQIADAQEILARNTVIHPSKEAFDALLEEWPAIPESASEAFRDLLGMKTADSGK